MVRAPPPVGPMTQSRVIATFSVFPSVNNVALRRSVTSHMFSILVWLCPTDRWWQPSSTPLLTAITSARFPSTYSIFQVRFGYRVFNSSPLRHVFPLTTVIASPNLLPLFPTAQLPGLVWLTAGLPPVNPFWPTISLLTPFLRPRLQKAYIFPHGKSFINSGNASFTTVLSPEISH